MSTNLFQQHDISEWGFLSNPNNNTIKLPSQFDEYSHIINSIESHDGEFFRQQVNSIENGLNQDIYSSKVDNLTNDELKKVYLIFTFIAQKYTKCLNNKLDEIPYEIGLPWYHSATKLGLPCVLTYAASILYNCKLDENGNLATIYSISGTPDELHFYKVHITLENTCKNLIAILSEYIENPNDIGISLRLLTATRETIENITKILHTMYEECEPEKFWRQVRLYLSGYTKDHGFPNGLKVKGTNLTFNFGGGSAAQSSLIQLMDIILSIDHESEHGKKFLLEQREYMPLAHRNFLEYVQTHFNMYPLKNLTNNAEILKEYNLTITSLRSFRQAHYQLVHNYIVKFIRTPEEIEKGSGGLMFGELTQFIKDTKRIVTLNSQQNTLSDENISETTVDVSPAENTKNNKWWLWTYGTIVVGFIIYQFSK